MNTTDVPFTLALVSYDDHNLNHADDIQTSTQTLINAVVTAVADSLFYDSDNISSINASVNDTGRTANATSLGPPYLPVEQYVVPAVCAMGIILNILNLLVLSERCLKESPYTYLTAMAILCLASLTMSFISHSSMHKCPHSYLWLTYTFKVYFPCVNICSNSTMWLTAMLTIERFLFVRHPLWARAKCDRRSAKMKICVIIILMMLLNIPRFLLYDVVPDETKGPGHYKYALTAFRQSDTFVAISWFYSAVIQIMPMSILCATNFYLVYAVHKARLLRKRMQIRNNMEAEWSREQTRLTITLISIVFFFIICIMPSAFSDLHVAYALFGSGKTKNEFIMSHFYRMLQKTANLLVFCQLSFNFVLYSLFNDKFLTVFKHMLKRWVEAVRRRVSKAPGRNMFQLVRQDTALNGEKNKVVITRSSTNSCMLSKDSTQLKTLQPETSS
nr:hypothetical protein BaRGS_025191 [Batillaria attramentaria]